MRLQVGKKDIYVTFRVERSNYFVRNGYDVFSEAPISIAQAILGGSTRIKGLHENITVDVSFT
jgi:DnaJ family protein A protein 3